MSSTIFEASASGDIEYIKKHLGDIGAKNERGWTALHFAARYGQLQVAEFLVQQKGCDLSATNSEGKTALEVAEFWGFDQVADLLRSASSKDDEKKSDTSRFPANRTNFFAGSPLNRYSWYRSDKQVLQRLVRSPRSKFLLFSHLNPLFYEGDGGLYFAPYTEVASIVDEIYPPGDDAKEESQKPIPEGNEVILVFLGIDEREQKGEDGIAYWALDVTPRGANEDRFKALAEGFKERQLAFIPALPRVFTIDKEEAAILAQARAMVDWNERNQFCPACGRKTLLSEGGHKRTCPPIPADAGGDGALQAPCVSQKGVHNFSYPRTDPVVIVCIVHPSEDKILLGRQSRWPGRMHSCIAGFAEAGESIEEAVRREAFEETGVVVDRVAYHSSQPWPFPNSLMFGFIAEAVSTEVQLRDKELESAAWFTRSEVLAAMNREPDAKFSLPPEKALACQLIKTWATDQEWRPKGINAKM